jgi:hypothetical protein
MSSPLLLVFWNQNRELMDKLYRELNTICLKTVPHWTVKYDISPHWTVKYETNTDPKKSVITISNGTHILQVFPNIHSHYTFFLSVEGNIISPLSDSAILEFIEHIVK